MGFPLQIRGLEPKGTERPWRPALSNGEAEAQKGEILWPSLHSKQEAKPEIELGLFIYQFPVLGIKLGPRHARQALYH